MLNDIKIIGLGGIGSALANMMGRYLNHDQENRYKVTLIDGDDFEYKNLNRQEFSDGIGENKAVAKAIELQKKFNNIQFDAIPEFINTDNISNILNDNSTIFICVDNHKSRKIINDHAELLENVAIISGGNELVDGNVQIYVKKEGNKITPSLSDYHPEIANPSDKSPEEMSCEELEESVPQLYFTNLSAALYMATSFRNVQVNNLKNSEIYFDIDAMCAHSKERKLKGSGRSTKTSQTL